MFSSPSRGFYLSTCSSDRRIYWAFSFRPLLGGSIFLQIKRTLKDNDQERVFVPFSGVLSFYTIFIVIIKLQNRFRPLLGGSIFLRRTAFLLKIKLKSFRPLLGGSIFLLVKKNAFVITYIVFVPFSGVLSFYWYISLLVESLTFGFRPLLGGSIFLRLLLYRCYPKHD